MATLHISETEAANDFPGLLARVRNGAEVIIESDHKPVAVLRSAGPVRRTISETIALLDALETERGHPLVMDEDYASDMDEIVRNRKPRDTSAWD
ncbi:MAG: type II toxin-antitoxin system Phd/YefM family antitoxin [Acidobacteriota bacterium]|nr:type II toxin-antitoxin system Phd/YefM family antitoxin [Acidobacteriota bacterium]